MKNIFKGFANATQKKQRYNPKPLKGEIVVVSEVGGLTATDSVPDMKAAKALIKKNKSLGYTKTRIIKG